ncbi:MAG: hypothetical protein AB1657_04510 [Candidatus Micrarchaeota archaeon]
MIRANVIQNTDGSISGTQFATPFHTRRAYEERKGHIGQPVERRAGGLRSGFWPQECMLD